MEDSTILKIDWERVDFSRSNNSLAELLGTRHETVCRKRADVLGKTQGRRNSRPDVPAHHREFADLSRSIIKQLANKGPWLPTSAEAARLVELAQLLHLEANERLQAAAKSASEAVELTEAHAS